LTTSIDFKERNVVVTVDFIPWGVLQGAFLAMSGERFNIPVIAKAKLANINQIFMGK
jgi:hypothetical protein